MDEIEFKRKMEYIVSMMKEQGYEPYEQLAYYVLLDGNPYFITSHGNAREMINKLKLKDIYDYLSKNGMNWSRWLKDDKFVR